MQSERSLCGWQRNLYLRYMVKRIDWEFIVPIKIYIFDVTDTWKRLDNSAGQTSEHECHVEYEVDSCSASGMAYNGCTDIKRTASLCQLVAMSSTVWPINIRGVLVPLFMERCIRNCDSQEKDGQVLYSSLPTYGQGKVAGNEAGYIVGMSTCYPQPGSVKINDRRH